MADVQAAQEALRARYYDKMIKQTAAQTYKFKQAVSIVTTSAWKGFFWRENQTILAGKSGNATKGIPRGSEFPQASVKMDQIRSTIEKYGLEDTIPYEDVISDDLDLRDRTLIRLSAGVAKAVDDEIWAQLTENQTPVNIQSFTLADNYDWASASAAIIDDLEQAEEKLANYNYDTSNLMVFVSPKDKRRIVTYFYEKGAQAPDMSMRMIDSNNGVIGKIGNKTFIVSKSVTASFALVVVPKQVGTWKSLVPLGTDTKEVKYKQTTITACELGTTELTDPKAAVLIVGTQPQA